ncbi:MAG: hypothetical protein PUB18_03940 [bacterium]|nr:hypothetical protein [bacterium]
MFSKDSILYQLNVVSKIIALMMMIISIILAKMPILMIIIALILLYLAFNFKYLLIYSLLILVLSISNIFYPLPMWIIKILMIFGYVVLVKKCTSSDELKYLLEVTIYKWKHKKITYYFLYQIYFFDHMRQNIEMLKKLKEEYGMPKKWSKFIIKKSYQKTKYGMQELMMINNLRFYNNSSKRTYLERQTWEIWDSIYLFLHTIFLIFIIMYGG